MSETILCLTSYHKGQEFMRACAEAGARTILLTVEPLRDADWPREALADVRLMPGFENTQHVINAVAYLARTEKVTRIVALDEFDMELAAELREHLRVPGKGVTATRATRDKLVMRELAARCSIPVPEFTRVVNHEEVDAFLRAAPAPWLMKPRTQASAIGIRKLHHADEVWRLLDELGDMQSHYVLERFVPGNVYHVDGIVIGGELRFAATNRYAQPPFETMHGGGIFCSSTVRHGSGTDLALREQTARLLDAVGIGDAVIHAEFIHASDGAFNFLEVAARVGGAHIAEMVEAASGVNLWREWARLELAQARGETYSPPRARRDHAGVLISLARQEWPDLGAYTDPEIVWRMHRKHHAGLIVASHDAARVDELLEQYMHRFRDDFFASMPAPDKATN